MNTNILKERETERNLSDALARGALLWAPIYSVGAATVSYSMLAENPSGTTTYGELLSRAFLILSPLCMALEATGWAVFSKLIRLRRLGDRKAPLPKLVHFVPPMEARKLEAKHAA
ncbi:hypothetical protein [Pontiella sp.]|uniref:hypothetical protein n=1 Tax=Pontiella sp. TaxID=2837462 RepID=UPI00356961DB